MNVGDGDIKVDCDDDVDVDRVDSNNCDGLDDSGGVNINGGDDNSFDNKLSICDLVVDRDGGRGNSIDDDGVGTGSGSCPDSGITRSKLIVVKIQLVMMVIVMMVVVPMVALESILLIMIVMF